MQCHNRFEQSVRSQILESVLEDLVLRCRVEDVLDKLDWQLVRTILEMDSPIEMQIFLSWQFRHR